MAISDIVQTGMSIDDFIRLFDEAPFELIDGERIPVMQGVARHNNAIRALFRALDQHVTQNGLGEVFQEAPFILAHSSNWVKGSRLPDVMFIQKERMEQYKADTPDWQDKPYAIVPDIVIEVVSINDKYTEINKKIGLYLSDGVRLVLIADPYERNVHIHDTAGTIDLRSEGDLITGGEVLPGFSMLVEDIFTP